MASSPMPLTASERHYLRTRHLRNPHAASGQPDTTDYELTASAAQPTFRYLDQPPAKRAGLDDAAARQFHQRLRLCCLIATAPFAFFVLCGLTDVFELLGRDTLGWTGVTLGAIVLLGLGGTAAALFRLAGEALGDRQGLA